MAIQGTHQSTQRSERNNTTARTNQQVEAAADLTGVLQRMMLDVTKAQPSDILQLQRVAGNRAVSTLIQQRTQAATVQPKLMVGPADDRYEREADKMANQVMRMQAPATPRLRVDEEATQRQAVQRASVQHEDKSSADGFVADKHFTRQLSASKSGGKPLPSQTRAFMESRFNADFSGVRVHTDNSAAKLSHTIQAKAFTHGNSIYFNRGSYAPDTSAGKRLLAHELTHVVQQGAAVQRAPDQQTPRIQRKHDNVIQRSFTSWLKSKFSKKKSGDKEGSDSTSKGTDSTTSAPTTTDTSTTPPTDDLRKDAIIFERNLGRYAFNHPKANNAAKTMMDKMTNVLIGELEEGNAEQEKQIAETYGRDDVHSAGQVGKDVKAVLGVLKEGNLRERMTALMNAMFGPFKSYVRQAMKDSAWDEMRAKGLNVEKLKRRKRQLRFNLGAKDLFRDPGNPLDRKKFSTYQYLGTTRTAKKGTSERTVGELEQGNFSIGLSEREKALQFPGKSDDEIANEKLKWMEGGTYWAVNHKNKWVKKVEETLHMPVIAGPSGTMLRMFQTWEYLNKPVPAVDWRLAVLAWMLTSNDHSFHEMMLTASDFGMPYIPGPMAYMNIAPLSLMELRQYVAEDGLFPHEHQLARKVKSGDIKHLMDKGDLKTGKSMADDFATKPKKERGALSGPGAAAIKLYTGFGYLALNPTRKGGKFAKMQIARNLKKKDEMYHLKKEFESGKLTVEDLMKEAREIIPVLDTALESLPDWSGELFRGTGTFSPFSYRKGSKVTFKAYTSSSLDESVAKDFADDFNIGPYKYILHLDTIAGKDVRELSSLNEDEILIPPGSVFEVTKRVPPKKGRAYYHIYLKQIARGGMGLKLMQDDDSGIIVSDSGKDDADSGGGDDTSAKKAAPTTTTTDTDTDKDSSGSDVSAPKVPKLDQLTLYDSNDEAVSTLTDPKDIYMDDVSSYTDDNGVEWVEISTHDGILYWVKKAELFAFQGKEYTPKSTSKVTAPSSEGDKAPEVTSEPEKDKVESEKSGGDSTPKLDKLTLYDADDQVVDEMTKPSQIQDDDVSTTIDSNGVEWKEIVSTGGQFYWVKAAELAAFLGKPYKPKSK